MLELYITRQDTQTHRHQEEGWQYHVPQVRLPVGTPRECSSFVSGRLPEAPERSDTPLSLRRYQHLRTGTYPQPCPGVWSPLRPAS